MATRELPTPELLRQILNYDPETGALTWRQRPREMFATARAFSTWNARYAGGPAFTAKRYDGYHTGNINDRTFRSHRVIWAIMTGEWPADEIDHINGVRSDNRWANLRAATSAENGRNLALRSDNGSGHCGIRKCRSGKWAASIKVGGKTLALGRFSSLGDAVRARKLAEARYGYSSRHGGAPLTRYRLTTAPR